MRNIHRSIVATTAGLLLLAACGSTGTSSKVDSTTTGPVTTVVETSVAPETTVASPTTAAAAAPTTAVAATAPAAATRVTVDPALDQALKDVNAMLSSNDQDMASASSAAANGG
jgi:hypothetical protein